MTHVLEVTGAHVELGGRPILRDVDLVVGEGETVALLGANGSGKSTLLRTALGLAPLSQGEVRLFQTRLPDFTAWHRLGFVPQRVTAASGVPASVWEVVSSGRLSRRKAWQPLRRDDRSAILGALRAVDLADRTRDRVATLSGGQQQRVLIARALACDPELLLLDEPMAGVNLASQQTFADLLGRLKERGTAIALVAHELGPLAPLVDRTVVMREGRVAYSGAPLPSFEHVPHNHAHPHDAGSLTPPVGYPPGAAAPLDRQGPLRRPDHTRPPR